MWFLDNSFLVLLDWVFAKKSVINDRHWHLTQSSISKFELFWHLLMKNEDLFLPTFCRRPQILQSEL